MHVYAYPIQRTICVCVHTQIRKIISMSNFNNLEAKLNCFLSTRTKLYLSKIQ